MSTYTTLLLQGAEEIRSYRIAHSAETCNSVWLEHLAQDMEKASTLTDSKAIELAIEMFAHRIVDSGPLDDDFCPSFGKALDGLQQSRKKKYA